MKRLDFILLLLLAFEIHADEVYQKDVLPVLQNIALDVTARKSIRVILGLIPLTQTLFGAPRLSVGMMR